MAAWAEELVFTKLSNVLETLAFSLLHYKISNKLGNIEKPNEKNL